MVVAAPKLNAAQNMYINPETLYSSAIADKQPGRLRHRVPRRAAEARTR
jgi:hypothetical protein